MINKQKGTSDDSLDIPVKCSERALGKSSEPFPGLVRIGNEHRVGDARMEAPD